MNIAPAHTARTTVAIALVGLGLVAGCHRPAAPTAEQYREGLVYMFPGVEGGPESMGAPARAIRDAGCNAAIKAHDWNRPRVIGTFANLMDYDGNLRAAADVAAEIMRYRRLHPDEPIDLVGYSGGGGMAVLVAEALPPKFRLRYVILCQAAVSPDYDLTGVLSRIDGKLVNFYSPIDVFLLGAGTAIFGTIDREHTMSAGRGGFHNPPNVSRPELADRLEQRKWSPSMVKSFHAGNHFGMLTYSWNRDYVGPLLAEPALSAEPHVAEKPPAAKKPNSAPASDTPGQRPQAAAERETHAASVP
jgi:pimeloyl-ACP methyl ester carboxylesterase